MKATSRTSAPNSSAITTMADAAPGVLPQMPAVPGSTRQRQIAQTITPDKATQASVTPRNNAQSSRKDARMPRVKLLAIIAPMMAWATRNAAPGTPIIAPLMATTMPAIMGPSRKAPGNPIHSNRPVVSTVRADSNSHRRGRSIWLSSKGAVGIRHCAPGTARKNRDANSVRAAAQAAFKRCST